MRNNLKQLAMACSNYDVAYSTLPIGVPRMYDPDPAFNSLGTSQSIFVSMLGQLEQQPLYDAVNFSRNIYLSANYTVFGTGLDVLWCPSDPTIQRAVNYVLYEPPLEATVRFTSYAGCTGVYNPETWLYPDPLNLKRINQMNGLFIVDRSFSLAAITDGTSNTLLLSERAHGLLSGDPFNYWHWWADAVAVDTRFWTMFPINPFAKMPDAPSPPSVAPTRRPRRASTREVPCSRSPMARSSSSRTRSTHGRSTPEPDFRSGCRRTAMGSSPKNRISASTRPYRPARVVKGSHPVRTESHRPATRRPRSQPSGVLLRPR